MRDQIGGAELDPAGTELALEVHNAHLIRRAHQRATGMFQQMMGDSGLTPTQLAVLGTLDRCPDLSQNDLAGRTAIDTATLSTMLRRLAKAGLLERVPSRDDQRVHLVRLTEAGRAVTRPLVPVSMQLSAALIDPVPPGERARFVELLALIGRDPETDSGKDQT
jgi:DNA-binding MarR family transcriptional regulator